MSKWYLDCVTDAGDVSIAHTGAVDLGPVKFHYSSLLESSGDEIISEQSLRAHAPPQILPTSIQWQTSEWMRDSPERKQTIFADGTGVIDWHCVQPRARARMRDRIGLGYVEHLVMTIAPWQLPIDTLRWGRFLAPAEWIVWIDLQGPSPRRFVYRNGKSDAAVVVNDDRLEFRDGTQLLMDRALVLRDGPLGTTALAAIPGIRDTLPARLLQVRECKWRSRARLCSPGAPPVASWAIHERVNWPD